MNKSKRARYSAAIKLETTRLVIGQRYPQESVTL